MLALETGSLTLKFDDETGVLYSLKSKITGWDILGTGGCGLSWKVLLPLSEELRNNHILGEKQKMSSCMVKQDVIVMKWEKLTSERGGIHDIAIELTVRADGVAAVFSIEIDNKSGYVVENVYCPCLINLAPPEGAKRLSAFCHIYAAGCDVPIWPNFQSNIGYYGIDYPTQIPHGIGVPMMPFILFHDGAQGMYMGTWSNSTDNLNWLGELRPGWESSIDQRVPENEIIAEKPVEIRYSALHVPYIQPGEKRGITPVALAAYKGGWQIGADIYKEWRQKWMKPAVAPAWAREPHVWMQLHINSPEDELRMRYTELPKVAEECLKYGVKAIQLVGWNNGGQDQNNPSHDIDPRLGTFEELKQAIKECQEMGVRIILFTKFIWADRGTKRFRDELKRLACTDPYGDYYVCGGYRYQTGTQLLDINTKRLIPMCFNSEEYLEICASEFKKVVDLGAAGMLHDECPHHGVSLMCFHPGHGHRYGQSSYNGDAALTQRFRKVPGCSEDFLFAGEAPYDWQLAEYSLSYYRTESTTHIPVGRYLLPHTPFMTAVTGFNDRNMLNQCLMFRFIVSYEPYNFKGMLSDFPETVKYGQKMDALRIRYRKWFWDGEFISTKGVKVANAGGDDFETYSVFKADDGTLGAVVCNYEDTSVNIKIQKSNGNLSKYHLVDGNEWNILAESVEIPARSAIMVL